MGMNGTITGIRDWQEIQSELDADLELGSGRAATVIKLCHTLGVGRLTEQTAPDFKRRLKLYEDTFGFFWRTGAEDGHRLVPFPREHVDRMVGLRTNATPIGIRKFRENLAWTAQRERREKQSCKGCTGTCCTGVGSDPCTC